MFATIDCFHGCDRFIETDLSGSQDFHNFQLRVLQCSCHRKDWCSAAGLWPVAVSDIQCALQQPVCNMQTGVLRVVQFNLRHPFVCRQRLFSRCDGYTTSWTIRGSIPNMIKGLLSSPKRPHWLWCPPSLLFSG